MHIMLAWGGNIKPVICNVTYFHIQWRSIIIEISASIIILSYYMPDEAEGIEHLAHEISTSTVHICARLIRGIHQVEKQSPQVYYH
jgi:hypothetical protein